MFSEFFPLLSTLDSEFVGEGVQAPTFFGHSKFEVKYFLEVYHLQSALDSEFFKGMVKANFFLSY